MAEKKYAKLPSADDVTEEEYADMVADGARIYLADELMKTKANLAFKAREAKRKGELTDTWVIDSKVMVKAFIPVYARLDAQMAWLTSWDNDGLYT